MFQFPCLSCRWRTWRCLSAHFATLPPFLRFPLPVSLFHLWGGKKMPGKLTGSRSWEQNKRVNSWIFPFHLSKYLLPPLLHSGAVVTNSNCLELKEPLWIMSSSVEMTWSCNWEFPLNFYPLMLWVTVSLTCVCAYYTGEKTWLLKGFLPKRDIPPKKPRFQM